MRPAYIERVARELDEVKRRAIGDAIQANKYNAKLSSMIIFLFTYIIKREDHFIGNEQCSNEK